jgi:hypothetical protein
MSQQINLFNPVFLKQKKYFSVLTMVQALGLIVLGCIVFFAYAWYQVDQLAKQTVEITKRYEAEQIRLANFTSEYSPQRSNQLLSEELTALEAQAVAQTNLLGTLKSGAIGNTKGYSEYLRAFARQTVNGLWLTGFDINGDGAQMSLQGAVTNPQLLPAYIQRMNKESVMRGKSFSALQMKQPKPAEGKPAVRSYVEFSLLSTETGGGSK